jgi:1,4-alpha-glucan branching enzyme
MIALAKTHRLLDTADLHLVYEHSDNKLIVFARAGLLFAFNFHPAQSYNDYRFEAPPGTYRMLLTSDAARYGGHSRLTADQEHLALPEKNDHNGQHHLSLYLPSRTAIVLQHFD